MNVESELLSKNRDAFNRVVNLMRSLIVKNEAEAIRIAQDILKSHKIPIPRAEWM